MLKKDQKLQKIWKPSKKMLRAASDSQKRLMDSDEEFTKALEILDQHPKRVTIFGSARDIDSEEKNRQAAYDVALKLAKKDYAIVSGGGGGIMAAANKGAFDGGGVSIGFNIKLPHEQKLNPFTTHNLAFHYFFTRKVMMTFFSHAYIYFPGGFGTLDELFEIVTLIQTKKMPPLKIVLFGKDFWQDLEDFIVKKQLEIGFISPGDEKIIHITDDVDEVIRLVDMPEEKL